jgi:hypothetical protein
MGGTGNQSLKSDAFFLILVSFLSCIAGGNAYAQPASSFDSVHIDAFDAEAWNGIVFLARAFNQPAPFALRVGSRSGGFLDGNEIFDAVGEVGPHAPDASYCRLAWQHHPREALVTLEWSRLDPTTLVGRLSAAKNFQLVLETYFPYLGVSWGTQGFYSINEAEQAVIGERYFDHVFGPVARFVVMVDRPLLGSGIYPSLAQLRENMNGSGKLVSSIAGEPTAGAAGLEFTTEGSAAHFVATLGWDKETLTAQAKGLLAPGKIDAILKEKGEAYAASRPRVKGLFEGAPEAIGNSMFWNTLYAPSNGLIFPQHQPPLGAQLGWLGGGGMGLLLRIAAQQLRGQDPDGGGNQGDSSGANRHGPRAQYCLGFRYNAGSLPTARRLLYYLESLPENPGPGVARVGLPAPEEVARMVAP